MRPLVVTGAQNATPVDKKFWATLLRYVKDRKADLIVLPWRYVNPTSVWSQRSEDHDWWAEEVQPYLLRRRKQIGNLVLLGDVSIRPTAHSPLSGMEAMTGRHDSVVGHAKVSLRSVATAADPKTLYSTGACTRANYTDSKEGRKGEFHHTVAALVFERGRGRQLVASRDGSFCDLDRHWTAEGSKKARPEALVLGDWHSGRTAPRVKNALRKQVRELRPKRIVLHDFLDFEVRNHHNKGRPLARFSAMKHRGYGSVAEELLHAGRDLDELAAMGDHEIVIVRSNHDEALDRWLDEQDPRVLECPDDLWLYHHLSQERIDGRNPLAYMLGPNRRAEFLETDESYRVCGVELGMHGHRGPNGSRGSPLLFSRLGDKTITGHTHVPEIRLGAYVVGTSSLLQLGYNKGPSGWQHCHALVYLNGKRTLLFV